MKLLALCVSAALAAPAGRATPAKTKPAAAPHPVAKITDPAPPAKVVEASVPDPKAFLAARSVSLIWGVGRAFQQTLERDGITLIGQLQNMERNELIHRYGVIGARLYHFARGEDVRSVSAEDETKSISSETTFNADISAYDHLERILWQLSEKVSRRAKHDGLAGLTVALKLKTTDSKTRSRNTTLSDPTQLAHNIF